MLYKDGVEVGAYLSNTAIAEDGSYRIVVKDLANNATEAVFSIDKTAPTLTITGVENGGSTKDGVTLSAPSEDSEVELYLNDKEVEYTPDETLKKAGKYKVVVTDTVGNTTEYNFEILAVKKENNAGKVIGIIIASLVGFGAVGAGALWLLKRRNGGE